MLDNNETENIKENNFPISPIGNPEFIKNIYHCIEREFDTKKRHSKLLNYFDFDFQLIEIGWLKIPKKNLKLLKTLNNMLEIGKSMNALYLKCGKSKLMLI